MRGYVEYLLIQYIMNMEYGNECDHIQQHYSYYSRNIYILLYILTSKNYFS